MKKIIGLTAALVLTTSMVSFAGNQENSCRTISTEARSNVVTFGDDNNGVYFGNNIKYELSETNKDLKLEEAISESYHLQPGVDKLSYYYNHVDLNADQNMETFVYLVGPSVSGSGGSSALLFTTKDGEYQLVSRFTLVRNPIIISNNTTNGWRDIIMPVSGGGSGKFFAELKFDGVQYPANPSIQPQLAADRVVVGTAIVADDIMKNHGIPF